MGISHLPFVWSFCKLVTIRIIELNSWSLFPNIDAFTSKGTEISQQSNWRQ